MNPDRASEDVRLAADLAQQAGRLAAKMRADGLAATEKTSISDIVTAADQAAEDLVVRLLREVRPDDSILGEEGAAHAGTSGRTWVIDPVDGTYNFFHGLTWWCSAIALVEGDPESDEVLLGAIYHPHDDVVFVGGPDMGSTRNGEPIALRDVALKHACAVTYLHPPFHSAELGGVFARAIAGAASVRMLGSGSMDATAIAQGHLGVLFQPHVPAWDRLPGQAIIRGAGGITDRVHAGGVEWYVAGAPSAVAQVATALVSDPGAP